MEQVQDPSELPKLIPRSIPVLIPTGVALCVEEGAKAYTFWSGCRGCTSVHHMYIGNVTYGMNLLSWKGHPLYILHTPSFSCLHVEAQFHDPLVWGVTILAPLLLSHPETSCSCSSYPRVLPTTPNLEFAWMHCGMFHLTLVARPVYCMLGKHW